MIANENEAKAMTKHISCDCKCKFNSATWNNETCLCACKNYAKKTTKQQWRQISNFLVYSHEHVPNNCKYKSIIKLLFPQKLKVLVSL